MKKLYPEKYNGKEFIRLSKLPFNQMTHLKNWLTDVDVFIIEKQDGIIQNCVHYDVYEFWFDNYTSENEDVELSLF